MIATEELARDLATEVARPSGRTIALPQGASADARKGLIEAIAQGVLEIRAWPSPGEIGDSSYFILDTELGGKTFYCQFLSEPGEKGLLCELSSGFYGDASAYRPNPEQARALVSHGFSDGLEGNFRRDLVFDAPDAAATIAEQTVSLLGSVLGWIPGSPITAKISHARRAGSAPVLDGLSRSGMIELLTRHGLEARPTPGREPTPENASVEAAIGGSVFTILMADPVEKASRYRLIAARAQVGRNIEAGATNPFNAQTWLGRSWVNDRDAYVEASLRIAGVTEDALHQWLERWGVALATARSWYRRVELATGQVALEAHHFNPAFHNLQRMARCHVKPAAEEAAIEAFTKEARSPDSPPGDIDAWTFFEQYTAANPDTAMPIEGKFVSSASAADIVAWLDRIDGVQTTVATSGELEICHAVPGGTLRISPGTVRRVALCPERFGVSATIEAAGGVLDVLIGRDDFYFATDEGHVEVDGIHFHGPEMPPSISWFETKQRLRTLEREMAWGGLHRCGGVVAWMHGALAGAERVGLVCAAERQRFASVLEGARRSLRATTEAAPG